MKLLTKADIMDLQQVCSEQDKAAIEGLVSEGMGVAEAQAHVRNGQRRFRMLLYMADEYRKIMERTGTIN